MVPALNTRKFPKEGRTYNLFFFLADLAGPYVEESATGKSFIYEIFSDVDTTITLKVTENNQIIKQKLWGKILFLPSLEIDKESIMTVHAKADPLEVCINEMDLVLPSIKTVTLASLTNKDQKEEMVLNAGSHKNLQNVFECYRQWQRFIEMEKNGDFFYITMPQTSFLETTYRKVNQVNFLL